MFDAFTATGCGPRWNKTNRAMVNFFRKRLVQANRDGTFTIRFPDFIRELLVDLGSQLDTALDHDTNPDLHRLFPTAYADDAERDAGYQVFARGELIDSRREAIALLAETANNETLTDEELTSWMHVVNDVRLVLGTRLDVSEDGHDDVEPDHPDHTLYVLYHELGMILSEIVDGLMSALEQQSDGDEPDDDLEGFGINLTDRPDDSHPSDEN